MSLFTSRQKEHSTHMRLILMGKSNFWKMFCCVIFEKQKICRSQMLNVNRVIEILLIFDIFVIPLDGANKVFEFWGLVIFKWVQLLCSGEKVLIVLIVFWIIMGSWLLVFTVLWFDLLLYHFHYVHIMTKFLMEKYRRLNHTCTGIFFSIEKFWF